MFSLKDISLENNPNIKSEQVHLEKENYPVKQARLDFFNNIRYITKYISND